LSSWPAFACDIGDPSWAVIAGFSIGFTACCPHVAELTEQDRTHNKNSVDSFR
jgi:hypothetical protein